MSTQHSGVHSVQFYDHDGDLIKSVAAMLAASLSFGDAALVVATPEHRQQIAYELEALGIDVSRCGRDGRYMPLDAEQVLSSITRNGHPDRELFDANFGSVLNDMRQRSQNQNRGLTVYGECVALLYQDGHKEDALTIERFWQDLFRDDRTFHLHCGYPKSVFADSSEMRLVEELHTQVFQHSLSRSSAV